MKFLVTIFFLINSITVTDQPHVKSVSLLELKSFNNVPDDLDGCTSSLYSTIINRTKQIGYLFFTDYKVAVILVNGKLERLKIEGNYQWEKQVYKNNQYRVIFAPLKRKDQAGEYYTMDAVLTVEMGSKIVYRRILPGDGGC
ncbi:hypothetical protein ACFQ3S_16895 [Mucilaginibacter terrae]|uniref:hypothetical protein n=1 Tax=Mucilaginibacter terrae TaxID=1955052 RepID=UPI003626A820